MDAPEPDIVGRLAGAAAAPGPADGVPAYHTPVFVPAHPRYPADGAPRIAVELLEHAGTTPVPVAFTTLRKLVDALGPAQPWVACSIGPFTEAVRDAGLPKVRLDPSVAPGIRTWRTEDLRAYAQEVGRP
ncbi:MULTISPECIES: SAV_915 family protein [Streptomycetaceae]|uniref:Uncharacterized protein n=1 Tax=Streptantibioticus cattleyicolor (strain ATCC 35852 / DSM 46488 / JCM 4925 / NBRC 14057 / NRRL 8057) TaxID=1003195 RepID=F8JXE0_STREN|nr:MULTISPECIES: SAV_915 family protein [Streptomycetaceae]AEW95821.1 hypothetical protein SCATT_34500 [Streptantibioticus cattleyicolor NRRL 8057 = DSM 46488]MYS60363.1 hypothetical protein [Streptomyces sp. SID5468]CCB76159.1 protein of unknown function [Streptantibioticus cattleyicolor NRRL 8057 = DSM 46488]